MLASPWLAPQQAQARNFETPEAARRFASACSTRWMAFWNRRALQAEKYFAQTDRPIGEYLPLNAEPRLVDGTLVRYSDEQLKALREAADTYFSWRGRTDSAIDDFKKWLQARNGENFIPLSEENLHAWRERGWSLRQVLDFLYDNFQRRTYTRDLAAEAAEAQAAASRGIIRRAAIATGRRGQAIAKGIGKSVLGQWQWFGASILALGLGKTALEQALGYQVSIDRVQQQARRIGQDREPLLTAMAEYGRMATENDPVLYFNDTTSIERWLTHDSLHRTTLTRMYTEALKLQATVPLPQELVETNRESETQYRELYERLIESYRRTEVQRRRNQQELDEHRREYPNLSDDPNSSPTLRHEVYRRANLVNNLSEQERLIREFRNDIAALVAQWRMRNTIQVAMHEGRHHATPVPRGETRPPLRENMLLNAERTDLRRIMRQLQELGLFSDFAASHQALVESWLPLLRRELR